MNPDDLINLPDNRPWRLEHVEDIEHFENGFYNVICYFQHVKPWIVVNYRNGEDLKSIKSYDRTYFIRREVNLEYVKCFPIGSIWQKGQAPIMPSYFGEFSITSNVLKGIKPSFDFIKDRIDGSFIASKEDESYFKTDCLIFEPKKPLFAKRLNDGTYSISKEKVGTELTFIKFFGYEIYRSFLTSRTHGTLNHRMLASRKSHNLVFDDNRTKIINGKRQVYLKNEDDHPNVFLIGNAVYDEKFKFAIKRVISRVLKKDEPERLFEGLEFPFDTFSSMKVYAKLVKRENKKDVWGLVVYQIAETQGYQKGTFLPLIEKQLAELQNDGNVSFKVKRENNKKKPKEKFENDPVNSDGDDDVQVEDDTLFGLMNPPLDQTLPQMSVELVDKDRKVVFIGKKKKKGGKAQKVGPSGDKEDPDGSKIVITLESMNYFPLFDRIVNRANAELLKKHNGVKIEWFDYDGLRFSSNPNSIRNATEDGKKCKVRYACVEMIVGGSHFYLFEKELGILNSENRSWLLTFPKFRVIRNEEIPLAVEKFLFDKDRSMKIGQLTENDLGLSEHLNHANVLPDKLIDDKHELHIYQNLAIKTHSDKILKTINFSIASKA